uniref:Peptidase S1 domain-containing protein n=1 Tax=Anopheles dirus TaxID=7168 RepID=A0A182NNZ9_9DIPT
MSLNQWWRLALLCLVLCAVCSAFDIDERIQCGRRKLKTIYLIRHGIDAIVGHWPWHATIFHRKGKNLEYACGGSILDQNTILTGTHCGRIVLFVIKDRSGFNHTFHFQRLTAFPGGVINRRHVSVQLGRTKLNDAEDYMQSYDVQEILVHPKFSKQSIAHDISLIKLAGNITMTKYVQPVCIWNLPDKENPIIGKHGTIVGFGLTENDTVSDRLKTAPVSVVEPLQCIESDRGAFGHVLSSEMICAKGQQGVSACNGDSGGGLFFVISGKWFVRGLVSFSPGRENNSQLCDGNKNTVFTDVAQYLGWITQYIDPRVLHDENDAIVDYDEKLKLFNFDTCGDVTTGDYIGVLRRKSLVENDKDCAVTFISHWITIHPSFDLATYANDIALIELLHPIDPKAAEIIPLCLPVTPEIRFKNFDNLFLADGIPVTLLNRTDCRARYTVGRSILESNQFCGEFKEPNADTIEALTDLHGLPLYQVRTRGNKKQKFLRGVTLGHSINASVALAFIDLNDYMDWILYSMRFNGREENEEQQSFFGEMLKEPQWKWDNKWPRTWECGTNDRYSDVLIRDPIFPWVGWLHADRNITIAALSKDAIATLIHSRFALAAAVIMENKQQWYYACQTDECEEFIYEVEVREITIHPNYTEYPRRNDLALIELWPEIGGNHPYVEPICLQWTDTTRIRKPLRIGVLTSTYFLFKQKQLKQENSTSCQRRFLANGYQVDEKDISICTAFADGVEPAVVVPGAPLQAEIVYDGERRHFLRGLSYDLTGRKGSVGPTDVENLYFPRLFTDINPFLDWIAGEVDSVYAERSRLISNVAWNEERLMPDHVHLSALRSTRRRQLFDFKACGADIGQALENTYIDNISWFGLIHRTNDIGKLHKCAVILISDWYGISTASCAVNYTGDVAFTTNETLYRFAVQKVIVHPGYSRGDLNNDIALIQLAESANSLNPLCVPILDEFRTSGYNRSKLATFVSLKPYNIKHGYSNLLSIEPTTNRYVDSINCQIYSNESKPKYERHQTTPSQVNATICIRYNQSSKYTGTETEVEGSPMLSVHDFNGVKIFVLRGISLRNGSMARYASMYYLEIDGFLNWIMDNIDDTLHLNGLPFDLREKLIFN